MASPLGLHFTERELGKGAPAHPHCLVVLPPKGPKSRPRVILGDRTGALRVFTLSKESRVRDTNPNNNNNNNNNTVTEPREEIWPAPSADVASSSGEITCMTRFGQHLFCMRGSSFEGYTRKGQRFFTAETNATEHIHAVYVETPFFFIAGAFLLRAFQETKELGFYIAPGRVHGMVGFVATAALRCAQRGVEDLVCCLGCEDRALRLVRNHQVWDEMPTEGPVTALMLIDPHASPNNYAAYFTNPVRNTTPTQPPGKTSGSGEGNKSPPRTPAALRWICYGTAFGSLAGCVISSSDRLIRRWRYAPAPSLSPAAVTCLGPALVPSLPGGDDPDEPAPLSQPREDTTRRAIAPPPPSRAGMWVGQEDGCLSLFALPDADVPAGPDTRAAPELLPPPRPCATRALGERIQSGDAVVAGPGAAVELFLHLFSGVLLGVRASAAPASSRPPCPRPRPGPTAQQQAQDGLAELRRRLAARTAALARVTTGAVAARATVVAVAATLAVAAQLRVLPRVRRLAVQVEAAAPIDFVLLRACTPLAFFATETAEVTAERGGAASAEPRPGEGSDGARVSARSRPCTRALALARPWLEHPATHAGRRLEVQLCPTEEGRPDRLQVIVYAGAAPRTAQVRTLAIAALPFYARASSTTQATALLATAPTLPHPSWLETAPLDSTDDDDHDHDDDDDDDDSHPPDHAHGAGEEKGEDRLTVESAGAGEAGATDPGKGASVSFLASAGKGKSTGWEHEVDPPTVYLSKLALHGDFTRAQAWPWLRSLLPGLEEDDFTNLVPHHANSPTHTTTPTTHTNENVSLLFLSESLHSVLWVELGEGVLGFTCDLLPTLVIVRKALASWVAAEHVEGGVFRETIRLGSAARRLRALTRGFRRLHRLREAADLLAGLRELEAQHAPELETALRGQLNPPPAATPESSAGLPRRLARWVQRAAAPDWSAAVTALPAEEAALADALWSNYTALTALVPTLASAQPTPSSSAPLARARPRLEAAAAALDVAGLRRVFFPHDEDRVERERLLRRPTQSAPESTATTPVIAA